VQLRASELDLIWVAFLIEPAFARSKPRWTNIMMHSFPNDESAGWGALSDVFTAGVAIAIFAVLLVRPSSSIAFDRASAIRRLRAELSTS